VCHTFCRKYYDMKATLSRSKKCVTLQKKETEQTLIEEGRNHGKIAGWHSTPHVLSSVKTLESER